MTAPPTRSDGRMAWGTSPEMSPFEILMWRVEADPQMRSTVVILELLDRAPEWERFVDAHDWACRVVARFRERIVSPLLGTGTPYWAPDPDFDLHYHLRRIRLAENAGWAGLLELAEQTAMTPLDPSRPLWEACLVEGTPGGAAYLLKLSHVLSDGLGLAQLLAGLHSRTRAPTPDKVRPEPPTPAPPSFVGDLVRQARTDLGLLGSAAWGVASGLAALRRPDRAVRDAVGYLASARRVLSPPTAPPLPVLADRGTSWRFTALDIDFAALRAAGKAAGGSVNDAYMAALLAAFRLYSARRGDPLDEDRRMPTSLPVSVRREDDEAGGNHFAPGRLDAPVGMVDPAERVRAVRVAMREVLAEPALESLDVVAPLAARLPGSLIAAFGGSATAGNDLQASNIPGLREEVFLAGARIDRSYPFAPLPGCAAMIAMNTHGSTCCVAANLDAAAIVDPEQFTECMVEGFVEVLALAGDSAPAPVARGADDR